MIPQRKGRRSKVGTSDAPAMTLVVVLHAYGLLILFSYYWCFSFSAIETSYVIYVLERIYYINCHATILCDGCLVLFYDSEVCLAGGILGVPMVIDFTHYSSDDDSIDDVPHAKLFISACLNSLSYLRFSTC
jgi:hypothetical protein